MSAVISNKTMMKEILKATGFDCPQGMENSTFEQATSGGNLEDNKEVIITENGKIEITPTEGKDGMKKVTATVNVASGGTVTAYAWKITSDDSVYIEYYPINTAPVDKADYLVKCAKMGACANQNAKFEIRASAQEDDEYMRISDDSFSVTYIKGGSETTGVFERDPSSDFTMWS